MRVFGLLLLAVWIVTRSILLPGAAFAASPLTGFDKPPAGTQMKLQANSMDYDKSGKLAIATGNVIITYGNYTLSADKVSYDRKRRILSAAGNVRLKEPNGTIFNTDYIELSDSFADAFVSRLSVLLTNQAIVTAQTARRTNGTTTVYKNATYTRCRACEEHPDRPLLWQFRAQQVTHDERERTLTYENASFEFMGSTLLNIPRFSHPDPTVSRKTGFLVPSFLISDQFGFGAEIPFYWNIAPNYDALFSPTITSHQGPLLRAEWRHRIWNGGYNIVPIGIYELNRDPATPNNSRFRGALLSKGRFKINDTWQWGWDGTIASDDTFLRLYDIDYRTDLTSQVYLTGLNDRNYFSARAYYFRGLLSSDDNDNLPYVFPIIDHTHYFDTPVVGGEVSWHSNFLSLQRDSGADSTRLVSTVQWERKMVTGFGAVVTPFASVRGDVYFENNVVDPTVAGGVRGKETVARVLPSAGLDIRMPFVRHAQGAQHIFEPIAQIILRPDEPEVSKISNEDAISLDFDETNLFDYNKFSGLDRWEGGTRANAGFNYTWLLDEGSYAKFTFGQSFQLAGRNSFGTASGLEEDRSDYVAALQLRPSEYVNVIARIRFDEDSLELRRTDLFANVNYGRLTALMMYSDVDSQPAFGEPKHREEIYAKGHFRLTKRWVMLGAIRIDLQKNDRIYNEIGFQYDDECFAFKVSYEEDFREDRDVDVERAVRIKFELKTVATGVIRGGTE